MNSNKCCISLESGWPFCYCSMEIVLRRLICMLSLLNHRQGKCPKTGQNVPKRDTFTAGEIPSEFEAVVIVLIFSCPHQMCRLSTTFQHNNFRFCTVHGYM
jgi:hypothetical protein